MKMYQQTLMHSATLSGTGLHTGEEVTLTFKPAKANHGIIFKRTDLDKQPEIPALANFVSSTDRGTTLGKGDQIRIHTVEHLLAALVGSEIDNCLIELDGSEIPIMDGSSLPFVDLIEKAGIKELEEQRNFFTLRKPVRYYDAENEVEIVAIPHDHYEVSVMVDYGTKVLGSQNATLRDMSHFKTDIAACRTFSFLHELEFLLDNGLIKGGDLNNAIVYVDQNVSESTFAKLQKAFKKDNVAVKANGILDNLDLHYPNEAARHKLLDVLGDLALVGAPIQAKVYATKPGHQANTAFAKLLLKMLRKSQRGPQVPYFEPDDEPVHDVRAIMNILPHRPPFLLVDKIMDMSESHVVGVKNVTMNEAFFTGHFPGAPVMPGVLQIEAMAQVGGILALSSVKDPENYLTYFLKMDDVKFKHKVVPGDTLVFQLNLEEPIRRGLVKMQGYAFAGEKLVAEARLMAQIVKEKN